MGKENGSQERKADVPGAAAAAAAAKRWDAVIPNPKLKLLDQVREVMRLKHCSTMIYTHVLRQGACGMKSPLDCL